MLLNASRILVRYLNHGSFEGCAGAKTQIVSLAEMVDQMFFVISKSETTALFATYQNNPEDLDKFELIMYNLLLWMLFNRIVDNSMSHLVPLSNPSCLNAATSIMVLLTRRIDKFLVSVGDSVRSSSAIKRGLKALIDCTQSANTMLLDKAKNE